VPDELLLQEDIGTTRILTLNRTEAENKLNHDLLMALEAALAASDNDPGCRAVVLTAMGEVFCCGGELGDYRRQTADDIRRFGERFIAVHTGIARLNKPVIAAVQGDALGGGFSLVEACDLAVASERARFAVPEIKSGLAPMMALTGVRRVLTRKGCMELALLGEMVSAARAREIGLVNWVCAAEDVLPQALTVAETLSSANPTAVALCKQLLRRGDALNYEAQIGMSLTGLVALLKSADASEALTAREAGRAPIWSVSDDGTRSRIANDA
jgi:enoyl-CoA hydratase/carnithine racemase